MFPPRHPPRRPLRSLPAVLLLASACGVPTGGVLGAQATSPTPAAPFLPLKISTPPVLDGVLDDAAWKEAPVIDDFVQQLPEDKVPPTERTEVRVVYDVDNLYLGVRFFDSLPSRIFAWTMQRDSDGIIGDDQFAFAIDSSNNGRDGFWFSTNPAGVRNDAQIFDEGRIFDTQWDAVWDVATRVDDLGWTAEIKIPFYNLRFAPGPENIMGINFFRAIRRKNEEEYAPYIPRNYHGTLSFSIARKMSLQGIHRGTRLQIKPYALTRFEESNLAPANEEAHGEVGLDVLKWGVTSNLTMDLTLNTDFAQVEADVQQVNLTRFPLFFPEKRDFFLENAGLFQFGTPMQADVFFSRRIGLSPNGEPIPLLGGVRLTGRTGKTSIGLLDVVQEQDGASPETNFAVARIRHDILARSSVGLIVTDREEEGTGGGNRVAGGDTHLTFHEDYNVDFFYAASRSSQFLSDGTLRDPLLRSGSAWRARFGRDGDIWQYGIRYQRIDPGFDPEIGFVPRPDSIWSDAFLAWRPRPVGGAVRQYTFLYNPLTITDTTGLLITRDNLWLAESNFQSGDTLGATYEEPFERLILPFEIFPGVVVPPGDYPMQQASVYANTFQGRRLWSDFTALSGSFYGGRKTTLTEALTAKFSPHFSIETHYEWDKVRLPEGDFDVNLWITRFNVAVSPKLFGSALLQINDVTDDIDLNLRVDWIHHPGSDLFFVYDESRNLRPRIDEPTVNLRDATLKLTYLFHF
jgi:hypothetical protein